MAGTTPCDVRLVLAIFIVLSVLPSCDGDGSSISRESKLLNVFNIVKFPNDGCTTASGTYGVCYTASECDSLGQRSTQKHSRSLKYFSSKVEQGQEPVPVGLEFVACSAELADRRQA